MRIFGKLIINFFRRYFSDKQILMVSIPIIIIFTSYQIWTSNKIWKFNIKNKLIKSIVVTSIISVGIAYLYLINLPKESINGCFDNIINKIST